MNLSEARENVLQALRDLKSLRNNPKDASALKERISNNLLRFNDDEVLSLKKKMLKRRKKREQLRRRKAVFQLDAKKRKEQMRVQASEAHAAFVRCQEREARIKTEESVRRQADVVLHEVTRRKAEAKRFISLLPALLKLREGRQQQHSAQGGTPSSKDAEAFQNSLEYVKGLWERQLDVYNQEEVGLKVILAEGSATKLGRVDREVDENIHEWELALFGEKSTSYLPWEQLVAVRRTWDQYVVAEDTPLSSCMPSGWVLPQPLTRQDWRSAVIFDP